MLIYKIKYVCFLLLTVVFFSCTPNEDKHRDSETESIRVQEADTSILFEISPEDEMLGIGIPQFGDLDSMISRRRIRALVPYSHTFYYMDGKDRKGIAYEALSIFEKALNKQLKFYPPKVRIVFIPVNRSQIIPLLQGGYGDLAFAGIHVDSSLSNTIDFSTPTITGLKEVIVAGHLATKLNTVEDLSGKKVWVQKGSSYEKALQKLNTRLQLNHKQPVDIVNIDAYLELEDILQMVNAGLFEYTVVVKDVAELWANVLRNLKIYAEIPLTENISTAWAFRKNSPQLKKVSDAFLEHNHKGTQLGNMLYNRYLKQIDIIQPAHSKQAMARLKATEQYFKKFATTYQLDWLLLAAQGYQESQLNQNLVSHTGAVGIMQVLPSTAASKIINIKNVHTQENNIHAGAKYMRFLIDHYFTNDTVDRLNQELLALAAYNAGPARVSGLRKKAVAHGLNANVWFDNVEKIAAKEIGRETVQYVSNIYKYYTSYRSLKHYAEMSGKKVIQ